MREIPDGLAKMLVPLADLRGADLRGMDLCGADLRGIDLCGADLRGAELEDANMRYAILEYAILEGANMRYAILEGANMRYAILCGAKLRGAELRGADLRGADLRGAFLQSANFHGADLSTASLRKARLNWMSHTLLSELLWREADTASRQQGAAWVGRLTGACWRTFLASGHPDLEWALDVLASYCLAEDCAPEVIRVHAGVQRGGMTAATGGTAEESHPF